MARGRPKVRLTVKLDLDYDADLIAWLEAVPHGSRSEAVRGLLRQALDPPPIFDLDALREVVAGEVARGLERVRLAAPERRSVSPPAGSGVEERFGGKLDRLLGGFGDIRYRIVALLARARTAQVMYDESEGYRLCHLKRDCLATRGN